MCGKAEGDGGIGRCTSLRGTKGGPESMSAAFVPGRMRLSD